MNEQTEAITLIFLCFWAAALCVYTGCFSTKLALMHKVVLLSFELNYFNQGYVINRMHWVMHNELQNFSSHQNMRFYGSSCESIFQIKFFQMNRQVTGFMLVEKATQ